eukprot:TRINITY_DN1524_c0_g1_i3.p1 TRINITY_DN1524_c0_g1~~TRINITY_DN1524_c0_g1_i3.p1  ORF type:complete len:973 (+),score=284.52 TRINITY_DN1524_c0_g1_i3:7-2925(+)
MEHCFIDLCSEEIIIHIFSFLGLQEKVKLTMVSQTCRRLAMDYSLELRRGLLEEAMLEVEKQNYSLALKLLFRVDNFFPRSPEVWKEIALCYRHDDDIESSLEALLVARKYSQGTAFYHYIQSQILLYVKKKGSAPSHKEINVAIDLDPTDLRAFIESGSCRDLSPEDMIHFEEKRQESLARELADYMHILPLPYFRMASIHNNIGAVYFEMGDNALALKFFEKATEICPIYIQAYLNRAIVWKESDNMPLALQEYNKILTINPSITRIYSLRGQCHYVMGQYEQAFSDFATATISNKIESNVLSGLYKSLIHIQQLNLAEDFLKYVIRQIKTSLYDYQLKNIALKHLVRKQKQKQVRKKDGSSRTEDSQNSEELQNESIIAEERRIPEERQKEEKNRNQQREEGQKEALENSGKQQREEGQKEEKNRNQQREEGQKEALENSGKQQREEGQKEEKNRNQQREEGQKEALEKNRSGDRSLHELQIGIFNIQQQQLELQRQLAEILKISKEEEDHDSFGRDEKMAQNDDRISKEETDESAEEEEENSEKPSPRLQKKLDTRQKQLEKKIERGKAKYIHFRIILQSQSLQSLKKQTQETITDVVNGIKVHEKLAGDLDDKKDEREEFLEDEYVREPKSRRKEGVEAEVRSEEEMKEEERKEGFIEEEYVREPKSKRKSGEEVEEEERKEGEKRKQEEEEKRKEEEQKLEWRIEAKKKQAKKLRKEASSLVKTALRFKADLCILKGRFDKLRTYLSRLDSIQPHRSFLFCDSLLVLAPGDQTEENNPVDIPAFVKSFTWKFVQNLSAAGNWSDHVKQLEYLSSKKSIFLPTNDSQLFFISCYAYFYFALHTQSAVANQVIVNDFQCWLSSRKFTRKPKITPLLSEVCKSPYLLVLLLEVFRVTHNSTKRASCLETFEATALASKQRFSTSTDPKTNLESSFRVTEEQELIIQEEVASVICAYLEPLPSVFQGEAF